MSDILENIKVFPKLKNSKKENHILQNKESFTISVKEKIVFICGRCREKYYFYIPLCVICGNVIREKDSPYLISIFGFNSKEALKKTTEFFVNTLKVKISYKYLYYMLKKNSSIICGFLSPIEAFILSNKLKQCGILFEIKIYKDIKSVNIVSNGYSNLPDNILFIEIINYNPLSPISEDILKEIYDTIKLTENKKAKEFIVKIISLYYQIISNIYLYSNFNMLYDNFLENGINYVLKVSLKRIIKWENIAKYIESVDVQLIKSEIEELKKSIKNNKDSNFKKLVRSTISEKKKQIENLLKIQKIFSRVQSEIIHISTVFERILGEIIFIKSKLIEENDVEEVISDEKIKSILQQLENEIDIIKNTTNEISEFLGEKS